MRLDRLPVDAMVVGFLITAMIVGFGLAFAYVQSDESEGEDGGNGPTESASATPANGDGGLEIVMADNSFDPDQITVAAGETITINLENQGGSIHNMRISGEDGEYNSDDDAVSDPDAVTGGGTATLEWTAPDAPGEEIAFRCDFHPTDMTGTITIE